MNELIILIIFLLTLISFLIIGYNYDAKKTNVYLIVLILISYLLSFRNISFLGMNLNANTIVYSTIIPILYLYLEKNKMKDTKKLLAKNNLILVITIFLIMLTTGYIPSVNDTNAINIQNVFGNNFRILLAFPVTLILSEYLYLYFYNKLKELYSNHVITIIISNSIIAITDIIIYNFIVHSFNLPIIEILYLMAITYIVRLIIIAIYSLIIDKILPKKKVKK